MAPLWSGLLDPRGPANRRPSLKETWLQRGLILTTFLSFVLLYKLYHPQTITPLDDFQMLWVVLVSFIHPSAALSRRCAPCETRTD
jgi:hypothetical protein